MARAAVADDADEALLVEPEHLGEPGREVEQVGRDQEPERAVELRREPARPAAIDDVEIRVRPGRQKIGRLVDADDREPAAARPSERRDLAGQLGEGTWRPAGRGDQQGSDQAGERQDRGDDQEQAVPRHPRHDDGRTPVEIRTAVRQRCDDLREAPEIEERGRS